MGHVATIMNQKGGVGKTTTTHNLAGTLARQGRRILLVDNDPQSSLSQGIFGPAVALGLDPGSTIHAIHSGSEPYPDQVIRPTGFERIDIIPGSEASATYNLPDPHLLDRDVRGRLGSFLAECKEDYDLILIDCPPNLYLCSWGALSASNSLTVPLQPEDYGAQGIAAIRRSYELVKATDNPGLHLLGYLISMHSKARAVHQVFEDLLRQEYGDLVFLATVPEAPMFVEAIMNRQTIASYKPKSAAAKSIEALAREFLTRISALAESRDSILRIEEAA